MSKINYKILENSFGNMSYEKILKLKNNIKLDNFFCKKQNLVIAMLYKKVNDTIRTEEVLAVYINDEIIYDICNKAFYPLLISQNKYDNYATIINKLFDDATSNVLIDIDSISSYKKYLNTNNRIKVLKK